MNDIQEQSVSRNPAPTRDKQFEGAAFLAWLAASGVEIGIPSNAYEVVRYRAYPESGGKLQTHIVYRKETGELTWCGDTRAHYRLFACGLPFADQPNPNNAAVITYPTERGKRKLTNEVRREHLLERDGDECWFCGKPLAGDATIEHLVPKSSGGRNMLANYALAHRFCNNQAANLPLVRKIEMRQRMRG